MLVPSAEESFQNGLQALREGDRKQAMARFEAAIELERRFGASKPQARYLSYYGLCLALQTKLVHEALAFCREAVAMESYNPDVHCNLGRALMRAGRRREAFRSLSRGLTLQGNHPGIIGAMKRLGVRKRPAIPFLPRHNFLNVVLGRLRKVAA